MGIAIPQIITSDRASGAQVIDGSLKFDSSKNQYLKRTPSSAGNRKVFTWSAWIKRSSNLSAYNGLFFAGTGNTNLTGVDFKNTDEIRFTDESLNDVVTSQLFRDVGTGWYHIVFAVNVTQATNADKVKVYVNGTQVTSFSASNYPSDTNQLINNTDEHLIGKRTAASEYFDGYMSQVYLIDGQQLDASYFGFTDGLTNTWKPKKYTGTFGTNGFWLPMDGNSPIGQDQSGQGNDWTPVNFGGSVALDNPIVSGARPILNTTPGGTQAGVGVFGSKQNVGYAVTVYNDGGGNKYYIDGVKQATLTGLIRGATYTFDTSDSSNSGHPFRFSESDGGSEYTNGVAAITGTATTITIPYNSSNDLYYYCTNHSGMGSSITGITTNEKLADQYASNCVLAVPLVGGANDVSASIACTMTNKAATVSGAAADSSESNFYNGSFVFDGSNDQLSYPAGSDFDFGGGDFTLETWMNMDSISAGQAILEYSGQSSSSAPDGQWYFSTSTGWQWFHNSTNYATIVKAKVPTDKWIHLALVREGNVITHYLNGVCEASSSYTRTDAGSSSRALIIGQQNSNSYFDGHLQDYRVYKGVAKYSGTTVGTQYFVPASTSPDILPDTPSGVSGGSKLTKITDGSVGFDGTGDYLSVAGGATDFSFGTGDFTIEYFLYANSFPGLEVMVDFRKNASTDVSPVLYVTSGALRFYTVGDDRISGKTLGLKKWIHIALSRSSGSTKLFVDGEQTGSTYSDSNNYVALEGRPTIGAEGVSTGNSEVDGIISNLRVIKGTALYTSNFTPPTAPLTNVTNTKLLCCQSNTSATAAAVTPGSITANGDAAATNFNPFNTDINTVRGQESGYATFNPLSTSSASVNLTNGNLSVVQPSTSSGSRFSTLSVSSGKWFCEIEVVKYSNTVFGVQTPGEGALETPYNTDAYGMGWRSSGAWFKGSSNVSSDGGSSTSLSAGDVVGLAFDADLGKLYWYKNGVFVDSLTSDSSYLGKDWFFGSQDSGGGNSDHNANFGQKPFKFSPPEGYQPLNAANVRPETVIARPDQYVGVTTYTGTTGAGTIKDDNIKFTPDFVWLKSRSNSEGHALYDTVRGSTGGNFYRLRSDTNAAQNSPTNELSSMIEGGFTVNNNGHCYYDGYTYAAWCWRAGGNKNTFNVDDVGYASASAAGLTGGSYSLTGASVGTKQGFSIVQWTHSSGTAGTINHGLTESPTFIIYKSTANNTRWTVGHNSLGWNTGLVLNSSDGKLADDPAYFNNTAPTSSVFSIGDTGQIGNGNTIAYCWHDVPGLQKFGKYSGNQSADGPFIELGFRPAIVWIKGIGSGSTSWRIFDKERNPTNTSTTLYLRPNVANGDLDDTRPIDIVSNGFKIRVASGGDINLSSGAYDYIYCAWADVPTVDLYGGGANAR